MKNVIIVFLGICISVHSDDQNILYHNHANHYHLYLWATYNQLEDHADIAEKTYEEILKTSGSLFAYAGYLTHLFEKKQYQKILNLMPSVEAQLQDNLNAQLILVKTLELNGQHGAADKKILQLSNRFSDNAEVMYYACISQLRNKQPMAALSLADNFLNNNAQKSNHFVFYYIKAQAYVTLLQHESARENIKKCLEINPNFEQGWLLSGLISELQGKLDQALQGYRAFLELVGHDAAVEQQILSLLMKTQSMQGFAQKNIFQNAVVLYRNKQYKEALSTIEEYLQNNQDTQAYLLKLELLCCMGRSSEAVDYIKQQISKDPQSDIWFRSLYLIYQAQLQQSKILALFQELEKKSDNIIPSLYLADIYLKKRELQAAASILKKVARSTQEIPLKSKALYQLAVIFYETKQLAEFKETMQQAAGLNHSFAPLNNLTAYYFASKGQNLAKAQQYLNKALAQDKNNIHYLDTQAYIWFKQQEYKKAYNLLNSLIQKAPDDFFILKHLSKLLYHDGKIQQAIEMMQKAKTFTTLEHQKQSINQLLARWQI